MQQSRVLGGKIRIGLDLGMDPPPNIVVMLIEGMDKSLGDVLSSMAPGPCEIRARGLSHRAMAATIGHHRLHRCAELPSREATSASCYAKILVHACS